VRERPKLMVEVLSCENCRRDLPSQTIPNSSMI